MKYLEDNGKVDLSDVQDAIEMKERQELLRRHPYKITQGKDGYWRTYTNVSRSYTTDVKQHQRYS